MLMKNGLSWYMYHKRNAKEYSPKSFEECEEAFAKGQEIRKLLQQKESLDFAHYYVEPWLQIIADVRGDSLNLALEAKRLKPKRIDFQGVNFMAITIKVIVDNETRVFVSDSSKVLSCSLVEGTDYDWIADWKERNPNGVINSYINSSLWLKSQSDYIHTSSNRTAVLLQAIKDNPGQKILILPDKFLGHVTKNEVLKLLADQGTSLDPDLIEVYEKPFGGYHACCYVHEQFGPDQIDVAMLEHPNAVILIHPECGCATVCMRKLLEGEIPYEKAFVRSTKGMIDIAKSSDAKEFIVATEAGHLCTLREQVPNKIFYPVNPTHCKFMKGNNLDKLLHSLKFDETEVIICEEDCKLCIDPRHPFEDEKEIHLPRVQVEAARLGIERMLSIQ